MTTTSPLVVRRRILADRNNAPHAITVNNVHVSFGQGQHGGWGMGMAVRTYRGDYAPIGWDS